jgi:hypothetical protein
MGRVAKYKKIKAFDPYSKKNGGQVDLSKVGIWGMGADGRKEKKRSRRSEQLRRNKQQQREGGTTMTKKRKAGEEDDKNNKTKSVKKVRDGGFDIPPTDKDEFDMSDLVGSVKRQKIQSNAVLFGDVEHDVNHINSNKKSTVTTATTTTTTTSSNNSGSLVPVFASDQEERKAARMLRIQQQVDQANKTKVQQAAARQPGESKRAYQKRTTMETRHIIQKTKVEQHNPEKRQKKKEFLTAKKKSGKKNKGGTTTQNRWTRAGEQDANDDVDDDDDDDDDNNSTDNRATVGDNGTRMVFGEQVERPPVFQHLPRGAKVKEQQQERYRMIQNIKNRNTNQKTMTDSEIQAECHSMDVLRRKVQAQYAAVKASRRREGDFHL